MTAFGRVEFNSYFRPPGSPGVINTSYTYTESTGVVTPNVTGTYLGAIYFPQPSNSPNSQFYGSGPNPSPAGITQTAADVYPYLPDLTSNPLHGLEAGRFPEPELTRGHGATVQNKGGSPVGVTNPNYPGTSPQYLDVDNDEWKCAECAAELRLLRELAVSLGRPERRRRDESLLSRTRCVDSPFGPGDLEWLYRQQDVDGATLSSRLSQLAPASFTNGFDGARRRRLFALDSWDMNSFSWTNDNPVQPTFCAEHGDRELDADAGACVPDEQPVHDGCERGISDGGRGSERRGWG